MRMTVLGSLERKTVMLMAIIFFYKKPPLDPILSQLNALHPGHSF